MLGPLEFMRLGSLQWTLPTEMCSRHVFHHRAPACSVRVVGADHRLLLAEHWMLCSNSCLLSVWHSLTGVHSVYSVVKILTS